MKITAIPQLYRNLKRWREILAVLRRYGLADWLSRYQSLPFRDSFKDSSGVPLSQYSSEERVRMALTDLGPTFIKLGQILAARPDIVGPQLGNELKRLRADVQPDAIEKVRQTLTKELGEQYLSQFQFIDPNPLATASIGQVHRATLNDGRHVVIKVQRADIERTVRQDMEVLGGLAQLAERVEGFAAWGPCQMVSQMSTMLQRELDFGRERQNLEVFAEMLSSQSTKVVVPKPVRELCTRRVLVMDELAGEPLSKVLSDSHHGGVLTVDATLDGERHQLSESIARIYLTMIFDEGLFHADPHLGNLLLLRDGRLGILDFGMVGRIDETLRESIEEMMGCIATGDQNRLTRLIRRIGDAPPTLDESLLAIDVAEFVGTYGRQHLSDFDLTGALNELSDILHRHAIQLPSQSALLLKMLISLEGTLRELGAGFDSLDIVHQFVRKSMLRRLSPRRRVRQARRIYLEAEHFFEVVPDEVLTLLQQARRGEMRLTLEHQRIGPTVNRMVLGLMASAVFLGSSLLLAMKVPPLLFPEQSVLGMKEMSVFGLLGMMMSFSVMMWLLLAINRSGHLTRSNED
ncbi:ABC1 kinase family protein [Novipirellula caenicola]|uniref:Protein kinase UbiB n=1 Tax=Novipirellula caenicola TaxID=1536901 RepID=A0ABP9VLK9_9BACT